MSCGGAAVGFHPRRGLSSSHPSCRLEGITTRLDAALTELEPDAVHILTLRYVQGYKLTEIAGLLGTSRGAVALRFFRVRRRLKKLLARPWREAMKRSNSRESERGCVATR